MPSSRISLCFSLSFKPEFPIGLQLGGMLHPYKSLGTKFFGVSVRCDDTRNLRSALSEPKRPLGDVFSDTLPGDALRSPVRLSATPTAATTTSTMEIWWLTCV
jgi:hypothetical protein